MCVAVSIADRFVVVPQLYMFVRCKIFNQYAKLRFLRFSCKSINEFYLLARLFPEQSHYE